MEDSTEFKILLSLAVLTMIFTFVGLDTSVVGEQLCVDGRQNINLEGIMCEKSETTWFGLSMSFAFLTLIPVSLFTIWSISKNRNDN